MTDTPTTADLNDDRTIAAYIEQGHKARRARLAGAPFRDWLVALARIACPEDPTSWIAQTVVLNEECWFDSFEAGMSPKECWAEECSYD